MLHLKRLEEINEADLEALKQEKVREGTAIDYKRAVNLQSDEAKTELVPPRHSVISSCKSHRSLLKDPTRIQ